MKDNSVKYGKLKRVMFYLVVMCGIFIFTPSLASDDSEAGGLSFQNIAQGATLEAIPAYAQEKNLEKNLDAVKVAQTADKIVELKQEREIVSQDLIGDLYNYDKISNINARLGKDIIMR